jgi:hypothetical protein
MNDVIAQVIIWASPFLFTFAAFMVKSWASEIKDELSITKGHVIKVEKDIVKIQSDIEHIKERDKIERERTDKFENHVVTVLKRAKTKFE